MRAARMEWLHSEVTMRNFLEISKLNVDLVRSEGGSLPRNFNSLPEWLKRLSALRA